MRLLAVTNQFPLPLDAGGPIRFGGLARALAREHDVHLLALRRENTTPQLVEEMSQATGGPVEVFSPSPAGGFAARWLRAVLSGTPTYVRAQYSTELAERIRELAPGHDCVVFLDDYAAAYAKTAAGSTPVVVDKSNVLGFSIATEPPPSDPRGRARRTLATNLIRRFERASLRYASAVTVTSSEEATRLEELYGREAAAVVLSAVDLPPRPAELRAERAVGWLGDHRYAPNTEGLVRFVEEAWGPLGEAGWRLLVPGRDPSPEVRRLEDRPGVELLGFVEDLDDLYARLSAAVVPLWRGAGVKLKTLTFMAAGVPTVATPVALEGVEADDGRDCLSAGGPEALAAALRRLDEDRDLARRIAAGGRRLVQERYTWESIGPVFSRVVEQAATPGTGATPPGQA